MNGRERVLAMLAGRPIDHLPAMPITMMFASDHSQVNYLQYATNYCVQVEAQLRVAEAYDFDYVSVISDPACEAADCGATVRFYPDQPPAIEEAHALLAEKSGLARLAVPDPLGGGRMHNRVKALARFKERVRGEKAVEGWIEGPAADAADLRGINALMLDFYDDPAFIRDLFAFVVEMEVAFATAQIAAGADLIGIGDAAASLVGPRLYRDFVWPAEKKLVHEVRAKGGRLRLHICANTRHLLEGMSQLGCDIVNLDSLTPLGDARAKMGPELVLLVNIDPVRVLRSGTPSSVGAAVGECHRQAGPRFIVGAGCEVPRDTPPENLRALVSYARTHSPETFAAAM
jgi:MtaA/CmuA family methyltransferase